MQSELWTETADERNKLIKPSDITKSEGKKFDMYGRLHSDFTFQGRALIGNSKLAIKLTPNSPVFFAEFGAGLSLRLTIHDISLFVHKAKVSPMIVDTHRKALTISPAKYPITRVDVKQCVIPKDVQNTMIDNFIVGQLPRRMFLVFVDNKAFNGSQESDAFNFEHLNIDYIACYYNSLQIPIKAFTPDFTNKLYSREYSALFQAINQHQTDSYLNISREETEKQYFRSTLPQI